MKQTLCQYGNCTLESSRICVTRDMNPGERSYFCSEVHAALYLLEREGHRQLAKEIEAQLTPQRILSTEEIKAALGKTP